MENTLLKSNEMAVNTMVNHDGILRYEAAEQHRNSYETENNLLDKALQFAAKCHEGQVRKGTSRPYIVHPIETMEILSEMKADLSLLIAGLLHDTLEDTSATEEEIVKYFGMEVGFLVASHSEDKSKSWEERKKTAIQKARDGSMRLKMLIMADKVSNLRSLYRDKKQIGENIWERFNAPKEKQAWYYNEMKKALSEMEHSSETRGIYLEMTELCRLVFDT